jgi:hypothetical protein
MSVRSRIAAWLDHAAPVDPAWADESPSRLDRIGGTYPTEAQVNATLTRATTCPDGKRLLMPWQVERATRELMKLLDQGDTAGEVGDLTALRRARLTADERRANDVRHSATRKWVTP